jgi:hypothetical protein
MLWISNIAYETATGYQEAVESRGHIVVEKRLLDPRDHVELFRVLQRLDIATLKSTDTPARWAALCASAMNVLEMSTPVTQCPRFAQ